MSDDTTVAQPQTRNEDPGAASWRCTKCRTEFRRAPRQRLLDARDRWRRDWCRTCRRATVMERG